jgi:sugar lactone lactonase YvrE
MSLRRSLVALLLAGCGAGPAAVGGSDCERSPAFPLPAAFIPGAPASEDFTFDRDGYLLALESARSLVRVARGQAPALAVPNVVANGRGVRVLPGGDIVIADEDRSLLVRVDGAGGTRRLTTTIARPNGLALGPGGRLYATDFGITGEVYRVDPDSGEAVSLGRPAAGSNGVAVSADGRFLYVGDHDSGSLYRLPMQADGRTGAPERWTGGLGKPDGLAVDRCGNVYAASWDRRLYRVTPAGEVQVVAELPAVVSSVSFGSGQQGWKARSLYVMAIQDGGVFEIDIDQTAAPVAP